MSQSDSGTSDPHTKNDLRDDAQVIKDAMELSVEDMATTKWRMTEHKLLSEISLFYSKKILMDYIDDRNHKPRQVRKSARNHP